jgi:hypothetical protein
MVLALVGCLIFLGTLDWTNFPYWRGRAAIAAILLRGFGPTLPYLISAVASRPLVTANRLRFRLFVTLLVAGAAAVSYLYLTGAGPYNAPTLIFLQTMAYLIAAPLVFGSAE